MQPAPGPRRPRLGPAFLGLLLALAAPAAAAPREPEGAEPPEVTAALEGLESPRLGRRREAVERLVALLPTSRAGVERVLQEGPPEARLHAVEVLARDGSDAAVRALLGALRQGDPVLAEHVRRVLVQSDEATRRVLETWAAEPELRLDEHGEVPQAVRDLETLLQRAEVERIFLSRKSRTGSTGYYDGQYAELLPYRRQAVELAVAILVDEALPVPGRYTSGAYTFLRPLPHAIEPDEIRAMAANAYAELGLLTDTEAWRRLRREQEILREQVMGRSSRIENAASIDRRARYTDLVVALYLVAGKAYDAAGDRPAVSRPRLMQEELEELLAHLESVWLGGSMRAAVLLRVGRYEEAIEAYGEAMRWDSDLSSPASAHYNIACAYASWAGESAAGQRTALLRQALDHLEMAVDSGWSDVGWMQEDRDLDPVRDTDRFRALLDRVRREVDPEAVPGGPARPPGR